MTIQYADVRPGVIAACHKLLANPSQVLWVERRPIPQAIHFPLDVDCSASSDLIFHDAGAPDIMGLNYNGIGNTQICGDHQRSRGAQIPIGKTRGGDICIMNLDLALGTQHMVVIMEGASEGMADPVAFSHGGPLGVPPHIIHVSDDSRTKTFFRPSTAGPPMPSAVQPSPALLRSRGLVRLPSVDAAHLAAKNGWPIYYFTSLGFHPMGPGVPLGTSQFAASKYQQPHIA